jgi:predicted protein tyrosine phosphatase
MVPFRVTVCGFEELPEQCNAGATHIVSILDPGCALPVELEAFGERQRLELRFHDIIGETPDMELPEPQHIKRLLALGQDLMQEHSGDGHLLIHCHAGFSRSPAALAVILAQALPTLSAAATTAEVLRIQPKAWPNLRIIELGDEALDRVGSDHRCGRDDLPTPPSAAARPRRAHHRERTGSRG